MKTFRKYIEEDMPTVVSSSGHIASLGVGGQGEPPGKLSKKKPKPLTRKTPPA